MEIAYLSQQLRELNAALREAFARAGELSPEQMRACRRLAMGLPCPQSDLTAAQKELVAKLQAAVEYARAHGLEDVAGWCMAAAQGQRVGGSDRDFAVIAPVVSEFLRENVPPPATVLDVACGMAHASLPLAAQGYDIALLDPADAFLQTARRAAERDGLEARIRSLTCGTFADLGQLGTESYDVCLCLRSLLYAHPRESAEEALAQLGRIASRVVVADVASKHGMILQLGATFEVSAQAIQQILTTGTTPPARPENGNVVYSCFSSAELRDAAQRAGLTVRRLVGFGITETLEMGTSEPIPADEAVQIEALLQRERPLLDAFPSLLALCTKRIP